MIKIGTNFDYKAPLFLDDRQGVEIEDGEQYYDVLRNWSTPIPNGFEVYCNGKWWTYDENNTEGVTGKFRERTGVCEYPTEELTVTILSPSNDGLFIPYNEPLEELTVFWRVAFNGDLVTPYAMEIEIGNETYVVENPESEGSVTLSDLYVVGGDTLKIRASYDEETVESEVVFIKTYTIYWGASSKTELTRQDIQSLNVIENATSFSLCEVFDCSNGKYPYYVVPKKLYAIAKEELKMKVNNVRNTAYGISMIDIDGEPFVVIRHDYIQTGTMKICFEGSESLPPYLTFTAVEPNSTIRLDKVGNNVSSLTAQIEYSFDDGFSWEEYTWEDKEGTTIELPNAGDYVMLKGVNHTFSTGSGVYYHFIMEGSISASGDITSLLNGIGGDCELSDYCFWRLFQSCHALATSPSFPAMIMKPYCYGHVLETCINIKDTPKLPSITLADHCYFQFFNACESIEVAPELPATHLEYGCYWSMFLDCSNLKIPPELPATILAQWCYACMFEGCTSLKTAPELPATVMTNDCYREMFCGCTSLTTPPELPARSLAENCYRFMFEGCTSLETAPELPATVMVVSCYQAMFQNCTSLTIAPSLPATELSESCYKWMFSLCSNLITSPSLPATTMAKECYYNMFYGCTSLTTAPELQSTELAPNCYDWMFEGCTALVTPPSLPATVLKSGCYNRMFIGCTSLASAPELPATTLATNCYQSMFKGCTSLTEAPELPSTTLEKSCYNSMFYGCSSLTTAPELPATTLADYCYEYMFYGCTSLTTAPELQSIELAYGCYEYMFANCSNLNYIKALFTTEPSYDYTSNWVDGVSSMGTFVKNVEATWDVTGPDGVPEGWTVETSS